MDSTPSSIFFLPISPAKSNECRDYLVMKFYISCQNSSLLKVSLYRETVTGGNTYTFDSRAPMFWRLWKKKKNEKKTKIFVELLRAGKIWQLAYNRKSLARSAHRCHGDAIFHSLCRMLRFPLIFLTWARKLKQSGVALKTILGVSDGYELTNGCMYIIGAYTNWAEFGGICRGREIFGSGGISRLVTLGISADWLSIGDP